MKLRKSFSIFVTVYWHEVIKVCVFRSFKILLFLMILNEVLECVYGVSILFAKFLAGSNNSSSFFLYFITILFNIVQNKLVFRRLRIFINTSAKEFVPLWFLLEKTTRWLVLDRREIWLTVLKLWREFTINLLLFHYFFPFLLFN